MRSLDPHHARIGYLGALAVVGVRSLDIREAIRSRLYDSLFVRLYPGDERFETLKSRLGTARWRELSDETVNSRSPDEDPSAILSSIKSGDGWVYLCEFWLFDERMPSALGAISPEKLERTIELARMTGVLLPTYELSETGVLLQHLIESSKANSGEADFNILWALRRPALRLLYLRLLLAAEMVFPFLICEMQQRSFDGRRIATRGEDGLLRGATSRLLRTIGEPEDPDEMFAVRDVADFNAAILAKASTEENYLRPRMEILVDLGLIARKNAAGKSRAQFPWEVTEITGRLASEWDRLAVAKNIIPEYLDREFFRSMARILGSSARKAQSLEEKLLWFCRSFQKIGREFGFTPGRTCALLGCLLAFESGITIEVTEMFEAVFEAGKGRWSKYFHYSGGSRFDQEFLIRIDPEAETEIAKSVP
jgi:hypothetical protein